MEGVVQYYGIFHSSLATFLDDLVTKLSPDAPAELQYLSLIPGLMPPNDPCFARNDEDQVYRKVSLMFSFTGLVMQQTEQYLSEGNQDWFTQSGNELAVWTQLVKMNLMNMKLDTSDDGMEILDSGIGAINAGCQGSSPEDLQNLEALFDVLKSGSSQQQAA